MQSTINRNGQKRATMPVAKCMPLVSDPNVTQGDSDDQGDFADDNQYTASQTHNEYDLADCYIPQADGRYQHKFITVRIDGGGWAIAGWGWYCWQTMDTINPRVIFGQVLWLYRHGDAAAAIALTEQAAKRLQMSHRVANQIVKDALAATGRKGGK